MTEWFRLRRDKNGIFTDTATGNRLGTYARPFAVTPVATADLLAGLIAEYPADTVAKIRDRINFDPELVAILDQHIADGWGHLFARTVFRHDHIADDPDEQSESSGR